MSAEMAEMFLCEKKLIRYYGCTQNNAIFFKKMQYIAGILFTDKQLNVVYKA